MTAIVSLFGFVARFAGDLLNTATGWAGTLMFGRVPQSHRRYLTAMLGGSVLWVVLVIVFLVPGILRWGLQTTPHPSFITSSWLAFVTTLGVVLVPLGVGSGRLDGAGRREPRHRPAGRARAGPRVPARPGHRRAARVPRRGRLRPEGPERAAPLVRHAHPDRRSAGGLRRHRRHHPRAPWRMPGSPWSLGPRRRCSACPPGCSPTSPGPTSGESARIASIELRGADMRVGIYPSDVAVSTTAELRTPIRAAILAAHVGRGRPPHDERGGAGRRGPAQGDHGRRPGRHGPRHEEPTLAAIDRTLLAMDVPNEEWDILYRLRLQAERDLLRRALGGTAVIDPLTIDATAARRPAPSPSTTPIPDASRASPRSRRCDRHADPRSRDDPDSDVRAGTRVD